MFHRRGAQEILVRSLHISLRFINDFGIVWVEAFYITIIRFSCYALNLKRTMCSMLLIKAVKFIIGVYAK